MTARLLVSTALLVGVVTSLAAPEASAQEREGLGFTPVASTPFSSPFSSATLSAGTTDTRAEVQTALYLGGLNLVVSASAPVAKSGDTQLASLDELSTGTTVSLALNNVSWGFSRTTPARETCLRLMNAGELNQRDGAPVVPDGPLVVDGRRLEVDGRPATWSVVCGDSGGTHMFNLLRLDQERRLQSITERADTRPLLYEFGAEVAREGAEYLDESTFEPGSETNTPFSFGLRLGTVLRGGTLLGAGLEYRSSYKAGGEAEFCVPTGSGGALRCRTGPLGAPSHSEGATVTAQARRFLGRRLGVNPRATFDLSASEWTAEVPVYFAPDEDGGLVGAVVPGYDSESGDWTLRLVVGAAFGLSL